MRHVYEMGNDPLHPLWMFHQFEYMRLSPPRQNISMCSGSRATLDIEGVEVLAEPAGAILKAAFQRPPFARESHQLLLIEPSLPIQKTSRCSGYLTRQDIFE